MTIYYTDSTFENNDGKHQVDGQTSAAEDEATYHVDHVDDSDAREKKYEAEKADDPKVDDAKPEEYKHQQNITTDGEHVEQLDKQLTEVPAEVAPQTHAPYPDKPEVQKINEALTPKTATGYEPHVEVKGQETPVEAQTHPNANVEDVPGKISDEIDPNVEPVE